MQQACTQDVPWNLLLFLAMTSDKKFLGGQKKNIIFYMFANFLYILTFFFFGQIFFIFILCPNVKLNGYSFE